MTAARNRALELVALTLVMEGRLALDDAVRVLMVREQLDRERASAAIVRAAVFASNEYGGHRLDRRVAQPLCPACQRGACPRLLSRNKEESRWKLQSPPSAPTSMRRSQ